MEKMVVIIEETYFDTTTNDSKQPNRVSLDVKVPLQSLPFCRCFSTETFGKEDLVNNNLPTSTLVDNICSSCLHQDRHKNINYSFVDGSSKDHLDHASKSSDNFFVKSVEVGDHEVFTKEISANITKIAFAVPSMSDIDDDSHVGYIFSPSKEKKVFSFSEKFTSKQGRRITKPSQDNMKRSKSVNFLMNKLGDPSDSLFQKWNNDTSHSRHHSNNDFYDFLNSDNSSGLSKKQNDITIFNQQKIHLVDSSSDISSIGLDHATSLKYDDDDYDFGLNI